jgi:hypothetical protein
MGNSIKYKGLILFELIVVIVLSSILFLTTSNFLITIYKKDKINFSTNLTKIEFESTKLFLKQLLKKQNNLQNINYENNKLYYNLNILQNKVTKFNISKQNNIYTINICIKIRDNICQKWIIR